MSIFLIAIPKGERDSHVFINNVKILEELLPVVGETYNKNFLGKNYTPFNVNMPASNKTVLTLSWEREGALDHYQVKGDNWCISAGHNVTPNILNSMVRVGGQLKYSYPVWGHYCCIYGDRYMDQVMAWNTTPALEAIHYSENEHAIFISNKPLLIGVALAKGSKRIVLSESYVTEYLLFGYSITGDTPFEGVKTINVNSCLRVQKGHIFFDEIPSGLDINLPKDHSLQEASTYLVSALRDAMKRSISQLKGLPLELRMSGGKDSRLLLGLLKDSDIPVRAVTFGVPGESETIVAQNLCDMAGIKLEIKTPTYIEGANYVEKLSNVIKQSDGIPPSEAQTGIYIGPEPLQGVDQGIMLGQWPLMKGGMARKMRYTYDEVENVIFRQASRIVSKSNREKYETYLREWLDNTAFTSLLDVLYLFARNFRSGRWLHGHIHLYSKNSLVVYPLADMEVCAVSDAINSAFRVSEKAYFMSLREIWPEALNIPLSGNGRWRFEQFSKDKELSGDGYELRTKLLVENIKPRRGKSRSKIIIDLSQHILNHPAKDKVWSKLTLDIQSFIDSASKGVIDPPEEYTLRELVKILWRILAIEVWYSKSWLSD